MPGKPFQRAVIARIREQGGWSTLLGRVADGATITDIAKELGCSRMLLSSLLTRWAKPKLKEAYQVAKQEAAHAHAEKGLQALEDAPLDRDSLTKAKQLSDYRKWLASVYDRETFGQPDKAALLSVTIQSLHYEALKAARPLLAIEPPRPALLPAASEPEEEPND